jgi:hypothetical protein
MSKRFNNRRLFYILSISGILLILTYLFKVPKESATLKSSLAEFDTASVNSIIFYPQQHGEKFEFKRKGGHWIIQQNDIVSEAQKGAVQNIFFEILNIKPKSLASVDKSKWKDYNLTDSVGTRLTFLDRKGKILTDIMIGKLTFKPMNNPYAGSGGNNVQGTSFVRLYDKEEVFSVEGFLSLSFTGQFDDYRDKSLLRAKKDEITKISFTFPSDSSYVLTKRDSVWYSGNQVTDSLITANYLSSLRLLNGQDIMSKYSPSVAPEYLIHIEGNNLTDLSVKCYKGENDKEYILNSNQNPDVYFVSKRNGVFNQLFKPQSYFFKKSKSD